MSLRQWIADLLELTKARITVATTLSAAVGYLMFAGRFEWAVLVPMAGIFLLACGSAALNQVQEWRIDAQMERTRNRPIPTGRFSRTTGVVIVALSLAAGFNVLAQIESHTLVILGLGLLALLWYNGLYVWMKRKTAFAAVPGALIGAVPPVMGWCAAGGVATDMRILEVAGFFFLWQIPHFWLLVQLYGGQYEGADVPMPTRFMNEAQFRRMTSTWIIATAASGVALTMTQRFTLPWNFIALAGSISLGIAALVRRNKPGKKVAVSLFARINFYALLMMILLVANAIAAKS